MTNRTKIIWVGGAVIHLFLVVLGACHLSSVSWGPFGRMADYYAALSGANSGYGFFAPGVGSQLQASFDAIDGNGQKTTETLDKGVNREVGLRIGSMLRMFWEKDTDRKLQRTLAASWAGKIFGRHPGAENVVVRIDEYELPSMDQYQQGMRPQWHLFYKSKFIKN